jgi:type VI secretion system protein ImpA
MPLRDDLLDPIPGENPSGANLRYDPVTDKIKEARREDVDAPQGEWKTALKTADYPAVIKMASDALAKRGKDLQIAVWLVDAHIRKEGFSVLAPAFQFLHDLLEQYWDTLYPEVDEDGDMEVRAAPLNWLGKATKLPDKGIESLGYLPIVSGKLSWTKYQESRKVGYETDLDKADARQVAVKEGKITAEEFDAAADATSIPALRETYKQLNDGKAALEALAEFCDSKFADFSPNFVQTREAIEEIAQTVRIILTKRPGGLEEEAAETLSFDDDFLASLSADTETSAAAEESAEQPPAADGSGGDIARQLAAVCRNLRSRDEEDPSPYMILRAYAWAKLMFRAPMLDRSAIQAPESDLRVKLKRLTADSEWDKVIELTEATMLRPCGLFWLDLQRYAVNAIEQKGYAGVARVVNSQFRIFLETLPDVLDITFPDDTPAANQETRNWIENFVTIRRPPPAGQEDDSSSQSSDASSDTSSDSAFSFDTPSTDDTASFDIPSFDTASSDTSSFETPAELPVEAAPELESFALEENPPILEAEQPPPTDTSDEFAMALAAVRDGRTAEGLGIITGILATERCGRQRFRRRTQLAHLLMAAGKGKVAQPLLDDLASEIEARRLEEWEPGEAIAYPLELLMHCLTSADEEKRTRLYGRICRLDPVRALNCTV